MNPKILISPTYFYRLDLKQWRSKKPYPPYGTLSATAVLRNKGYHVQFFDTHLITSPDEILSTIKTFQPDIFVIYDDGFNYLTKMCLTIMREAAFRLIEIAKRHGCEVVISSSDSTDHYGLYLEKGADFVILGEGEVTLEELVENLTQKVSDYDHIQGIAFKMNGVVRRNEKRRVLNDLDSLPDPAWDLVDMDSYRGIWVKNHGYFSLNMATTRGCPYKCNWCAKPIYGNRYNSRSPMRVAKEIQLLSEGYKADYFWMCDDIFGLKPGWVIEFNKALKSLDVNIKYYIQSRVDLLMKEGTIDALVESGLDLVWVGAESGSQKILDSMDKGTTVEQIRKATRMLKEKGIKVAFFLQFGYLGETMADIHKTMKLVDELEPDDIGISVSYPLPGTKFYEKVKSQMTQKFNWTDSDDLDMMYEGTYSTEFYRALHKYVHKRFRKRQCLTNIFRGDHKGGWKNLARSILLLPYYTLGEMIGNYNVKSLKSL